MSVRSKPNGHAAFAAFIDHSVLTAVKVGATSFAALLRSLPSVYPTELLASLRRLYERQVIEAAVVDSVRREASTCPIDPPAGRSLLPLPHPLDFEWRFTADASRDLLNIATDLTPPGANVLLFGTPGIAVEALSLPTNRRLSFLGEDNAVTRRLIALNRATGTPLSIAFCSGGLPRESADAVIFDPPWYIDFVRPMLAAAATACRPNGFVLVSRPPVGTRPSAQADRETAMRFAGRLGLDLVEQRALGIAYDTPFFETNALAATGIFAPSHWRRGDLVVFRKMRCSSRSELVSSGRHSAWIETSIGRMRLFVRPGLSAASGLNGLVPLIDRDVLPSVSRRDPRRRSVQIWTSGNRIFRTDNANLVLDAALACGSEKIGAGIQPRLWGTISEREALERVGYKLRELAALEAAEECGLLRMATIRSRAWTSNSTNSCSRLMATVFG